MAKVIVSYRRADSQWITGRIVDRLQRSLGKGNVFVDIDSIPIGTDFRDHLRQILDQCDVLLAVIGPDWLAADETGHARLFDQADWVRIEIETALAQGMPVIPVLIDDIPMPKVSELPESMHAFAFRQAANVHSGRDFHVHMTRLVRSINRSVVVPPDLSHQPLAAAVTAEETADYPAITEARSSFRFSIIIVAIVGSILALAYLDWLPDWGLSDKFRSELRMTLPFFAAFTSGGAILAYLNLRAVRLGTERAIRQFIAAYAVAKWLTIAVGAGVFLFFIGLWGSVLGQVISDWLTTRYLRNHIGIVHGILMILIIPFILPVCSWIEERAKSTGLIAAVIGLTVLLTAHLGLTLFKLQVMAQELPWWSISLISTLYLGPAALLVWGLLRLARAIHTRKS